MSRPFSLWGFEDPSGDEQPEDAEDSTDDSDDDDSSGSVPDAEAIAARAAARAERKAKKELAQSLGFDTIKAMTEFYENAREEEQQRLSEEEQRQKELEERESQLAQREQEIARRNRELLVQQALSSANVKSDRVKQAMTLVRAELAEADLDVDDVEEVISETVATLQRETPEWFGTGRVGSNDASDDGKPPADSSEQDSYTENIRKDLVRRGMTFD